MASTASSLDQRRKRFLEEHYAFVRAMAQRLGGPDLDAEDIAQDVFVVAYDKLERLRDASCARSWLYGICRRLVRHQRRRSRLRDALFRMWGAHDPEGPRGPEGESVGRELERRLYMALDRLAEKKREALVLFALEEMEGAEIAELLGIPLATVWTRLHAARRELLHELQKQGWYEQLA